MNELLADHRLYAQHRGRRRDRRHEDPRRNRKRVGDPLGNEVADPPRAGVEADLLRLRPAERGERRGRIETGIPGDVGGDRLQAARDAEPRAAGTRPIAGAQPGGLAHQRAAAAGDDA